MSPAHNWNILLLFPNYMRWPFPFHLVQEVALTSHQQWRIRTRHLANGSSTAQILAQILARLQGRKGSRSREVLGRMYVAYIGTSC